MSGYLAPVARLSALDPRARQFLGRTVFTYGQDLSLDAVLRGAVDATSVSSQVYERFLRRSPALAAGLQVIERQGDDPLPAVVAPLSVPAPLRAALRELLLGLHQSPEGRRVLAELGADRFVPPGPRVPASAP